MNKNLLAVVVVLLLVVGGYAVYASRGGSIMPGPVACTMEAKICPDGSSVGRGGPKCEFAECPTPVPSVGTGTIEGKVTLSPTCPVESMPPEPGCAPKAYTTTITIKSAAKSYSVKTDSDGFYTLTVAAGTYTVSASGGAGSMPPTCEPVQASVAAGQTQKVDISCDSGIR